MPFAPPCGSASRRLHVALRRLPRAHYHPAAASPLRRERVSPHLRKQGVKYRLFSGEEKRKYPTQPRTKFSDCVNNFVRYLLTTSFKASHSGRGGAVRRRRGLILGTWLANAVYSYHATASYHSVGETCGLPTNDPTVFPLPLEATSLAKQRRLFKKSKVGAKTVSFSM